MKRAWSAFAVYTVISFGVAGCGETLPPSAAAPAATSAPKAEAAAAEPSSASSAVPPAPSASPEDLRKAEAQRRLDIDRAKWDEANKREIARWTPELHAEAKALVERSYSDVRGALRAALAGRHRLPGHSDRDRYRHPLETLEFFGFKPSLTTLEIDPGEGWYTELLAPALAAKGHLIMTTADPNGPADQRSTFYGQRVRAFLDHSPETYGKVRTVIVNSSAPTLGADGSVDLALSMRTLHGTVANGTLNAWLDAIHRVLRPNGVLGVEEHRARPDAAPLESAKKGYLPETWLIARIEAAGFKLAGKSEVNANPKDTKDYPDGVWTLPPTLRLGDQDREKYTAIGESDRMTLKFARIDSRSATTPAPSR
jgi:predicted methyltransferase